MPSRDMVLLHVYCVYELDDVTRCNTGSSVGQSGFIVHSLLKFCFSLHRSDSPALSFNIDWPDNISGDNTQLVVRLNNRAGWSNIKPGM